MAANKSENKIRVVKFLGGCEALGYMDPKLNMLTNQGRVIEIPEGTGTVIIGVGSGDKKQSFYPHDLFITEANATSGFSWPSGDGSVEFGHQGIWPNGIELGVGSGTTVMTANGPVTIGI